MIALLITIVISICVICCLGVYHYAEFKGKELEFKREQAKNVTQLTDSETKLEIEREKTKQEAEKTKQLGIKADYREKHGSHLY